MLELVLFLIYASAIFFIKNAYILALVLLINFVLMLILKISLKKAIIFIIKLLPFILFTVVLNILLGDIALGILIGARLILVCNVTYVFSNKMTPRKLQNGIEKLFIPLKIFNINVREIGIMVSISIAFIPIIRKEMQDLKYSLKSKGFEMNIKNTLKNPGFILVPIITNIVKKTSEIEQSMISRGYF